MKKTIEEVRDWLIENRTNENGVIDLEGLDFGDKIVWACTMKAKTIHQGFHEADRIYQGWHKAKEIHQGFHEADKIYQEAHKAKEIYQKYHQANKIFQDNINEELENEKRTND